MSRYVLSNEALIELDEIWDYIARDDIEAAGRWIGKLLDACEMLAENPRAGHSRPEIADRSAMPGPSAITSLSIEYSTITSMS